MRQPTRRLLSLRRSGVGYKGLTESPIPGECLVYSTSFMSLQLQAIAEHVCRSETFRSSPRLRDFLRYLVKRQAEGGHAKETLIGVEFFQRDPGFDPHRDPIVRVEAHRLRRRLREYYQR